MACGTITCGQLPPGVPSSQAGPRLRTFVEAAGVEPTNNASERALRHAVIWRKLSFGTQSARGSRFVETLLTVVESCRQQSHSAFTFITPAVEKNFAGQPAPSILSEV